MLLSIVIPAYNAEEFIGECLNSCIYQKVDRSDYEVICIDDGSSDSTGEILDAYHDSYDNIFVIHQRNQGVAAARNAGLTAAKGSYIWFVDSDDIIHENCFAAIFERINNADLHVDRFIVKMVPFSLSKDLLCSCGIERAKYYYSEVWCSIYRKEYLRKNNLTFNTQMYYGEDVLFNCEFGEHPNVTELIDILAYHYRTNPSSLQHSYRAKKEKLDRYIRSYITGAQCVKKLYDKTTYNRSKKAFLLVYYLCCVYNEITVLPRTEEKKYLNCVKNNGLFPMRKPEGLTETDMRLNLRTDFCGRLIRTIDNWIYFNSTTQFGYRILKLRNRLYRIYRKNRSW